MMVGFDMFIAIKNRFATDDVVVKRDDLAKVVVRRDRVFELIDFISSTYDYKVLNAIVCTDWIEDSEFALTYILTTTDRKNTMMVQTMINRDDAKIDTISDKFAQAEIFERDLHELYGIDFIGHKNLTELSLENWIHTPPLRREFDTLEFVNNNLTFREGRDDNLDVKVEMKRIRAEKKAAKEMAEKMATKENEDAK